LQLTKKSQAQSLLLETITKNFLLEIAELKTQDQMLRIAFRSKDDELRPLKIELDQTLRHLFSMQAQMNHFHDSLIRQSSFAKESKERFEKLSSENKKRKDSSSSPL
jgi:hypothetical protein